MMRRVQGAAPAGAEPKGRANVHIHDRGSGREEPQEMGATMLQLGERDVALDEVEDARREAAQLGDAGEAREAIGRLGGEGSKADVDQI